MSRRKGDGVHTLCELGVSIHSPMPTSKPPEKLQGICILRPRCTFFLCLSACQAVITYQKVAGSPEQSGTYLARHMIIPQVSSAALRLFPLGVLKTQEKRGQWAQTNPIFYASSPKLPFWLL